MPQLYTLIPQQAVIRICMSLLIPTSTGYGNNRGACILMCRLRELGFKGIFEVIIPNLSTAKPNSYSTEFTSKLQATEKYLQKFAVFIPELKLYNNEVFDTHDYGKIKYKQVFISQWAVLCAGELKDLDYTPLTFLVGFDWDTNYYLQQVQADYVSGVLECFENFNTDHLIVLQPTNWKSAGFVISNKLSMQFDGETAKITKCCLTPISEELLRLSCNPPAPLDSFTELSAREQMLAAVCMAGKYDSQLIYGLYTERKPNPKIILDKILTVYLQDIAKTETTKQSRKPILLIVPQLSALDDRAAYVNKGVKIITNTEQIPEQPAANSIYMYDSLSLSSKFFDNLALHLSNLPCIAEGCNLIELLEFNGKPFVKIEAQRYSVFKDFAEKLVVADPLYAVHINACHELVNAEGTENLQRYLQTPVAMLNAYHQKRRAKYKQIPEALATIDLPEVKSSSPVPVLR